MSQTKEVRYTSQSITPPPRGRSRSKSSSRSRGRSRSRSQDSRNPGNNLYVTGLSTRVTSSDLEKYFGKEGRVQECHVVLDPRTKDSRGFAFVTMETVEDARRCIKYLNRTVLEGRLISVEKVFVCITSSRSQSMPLTAKRKRGRTPTPGKYCGLRGRTRRRSRSYSPYRPREKERSWERGRRDRSRSRSRSRDRQRSRRDRSVSPRP